MSDHRPEPIGKRIANCRKLRRRTQAGLAQAAGVSASHLAHIEQGHRQASPTVLAAIARALSVSITDLTGQPFLEELRQDQLDGLVQPIREALDVYDLGVDPDVTPRASAALVADAERLCALVRASDLRTVATELPALLVELTTAAHATGTRAVWQALAASYRTAYDVASKLGFYDLASIALDRMGWAAERASDPASATIRLYNRALSYLRTGQYRTGLRIAAIARSTAAEADPGTARQALIGQTHLATAVLAARSQKGDETAEHIAEAARIAAQTGEVPGIYWLSFGPTNVAVHEASALIDQTLYAQALSVAKQTVIPASWPASRAAHHYAEVARAQLWTGRGDAALRSLLTARQLAPQQARHSVAVRETVSGLVRSRRTMPDDLSSYATWVGM